MRGADKVFRACGLAGLSQLAEIVQEAPGADGRVQVAGSEDPLLRREPLPLEAMFAPCGFPVRVRTNSQAILDAAAVSWAECRQRYDVPPLEIRLGMHGPEGGPPPPMPVYRSLGHLLSIVATPLDCAVSDLKTGEAFGWVTPAALSQPGYFRYVFLEALAYCGIASLYLAPVHGAAVAWNGQGVLLCGASNAGKSSFAYACARRGWTYICDDAAYMIRGRTDPAIVGVSLSLRLREDARRLFPELQNYALTASRPNGEARFELRTSALPNFRTAEEAIVRHIVFLNREAGAAPQLTPMQPDEAYRELTSGQHYGPDEMHQAWNATYQHLLTSATLSRFSYSTFDPAIDRLERLVGHGSL